MEIASSVAVLAEHSFASVDVVFEVDVVFGVEFWLRFARFVVCGTVRCLHHPFITHTYPFAAVMACGACFCRDPRIGCFADMDSRVSGGLDLVNKQVTRFVFGDGRVTSFVKTAVAVGDMA